MQLVLNEKQEKKLMNILSFAFTELNNKIAISKGSKCLTQHYKKLFFELKELFDMIFIIKDFY